MRYNSLLTGGIVIPIADLPLAVALLASAVFAGESSADQVWAMEETYWRYVQANDLEGYRSLWRDEFVGWPLTSPEPVRKTQVTDWIVAQAAKGETLQSYDLERKAVEVIDNVATAIYRIRCSWVGKNGGRLTESLCIIHTWLRNPDGIWQIFSGMGVATNAERH